MLNLLIVDDEYITRETIKESVPWSELGITDVRTARNGLNALEVMEDVTPDILLCDIRMPKMNGIELASAVREKHPDCKIIFISGHADKEYLKSAIHLKAISYLEKPFNLEELKTVIGDTVSLCAKESEQKEQYERLVSQLNENSHLIYQNIVLDLIAANPDLTKIKDKVAYYNMELPLDIPYVCISMAFNFDEIGSTCPVSELKDKILKLFYNEAFNGVKFYAGFSGDETLALVTNNTEVLSSDCLKSVFEDILITINSACNVKLSASLGVGTFTDKINLLSESYNSSVKAVSKQFYYGVNQIYYFTGSSNGNFTVDKKLYSDFKELLHKGNTDKTAEYIKTLTDRIMKTAYTNIDFIKNIYFSLLLTIFEEAKNINLINEIDNNEKKYIWKELENIRFLPELSEYLIHNIASIFSPCDGNESKNKKICEIKTYIMEHYADAGLSTQSVAKNIYLSQTYLCSFFKKNFYETLNDFITRIRMEKAKEILKDSRIKLFEVTSLIGFTDVNYFSTLFKKHVGCTPSEYRGRVSND